ncbi:hypothetical protein E3N88_31436 [Mikania micrantha]|uniref:Integrase catalytic domain-containing protein n=1 Tax=Mikania micrantha TaxID=192012 RepID=A0A5N6MQ94_9ASTR|nr:hypothetical protein E3N88_31436 [Mikania micrantha]
MDFITNLPPSSGKTDIWVIVDRLTKFAHFIPLRPHYTATSLSTIFLDQIYKLHGLPKTILSDRDPIFLSKFWKELFHSVGTTLLHSSAYHPQTDGQTEVVNRTLESYLRCFTCDEPTQWSKYLYLAEFWYNTSHHSAIDMKPFQALPVEKLSRRYYGPFKIIERIGNVAYRLELPPGSRIHPVFHVSLLRACKGDWQTEFTPLPPDFIATVQSDDSTGLADKAVFEGRDIVTNHASDIGPNVESRPKRAITKPIRFLN